MKKALLICGKPVKKEDPIEFAKNSDVDFNLISEVAKTSDYTVNKSSDLGSFNKLHEYADLDSFLFYFTGHANGQIIGDSSTSLNSFFESISKLNGKKIVVLDACTEEYINQHKFPKNVKVIGAHEVYDSLSLAKLLHEAVIYRGKNLEDIDKSTFAEMKHNWVYVSKN